MNKNVGFTLTELMIASFIGLFLMSGAIKLYLSFQQHYRFQQTIAVMQENARLALMILGQEMRTSGYIGCPRLTEMFYSQNFKNSTSFKFTPKTLIQRDEKLSTASSDAITLQKADISASFLTRDMLDRYKLQISNASFLKNNLIIVSDCQKVLLAEIKNTYKEKGKTIIEITKPSHHLFPKFSMVSPLNQQTFYVKATDRRNDQGKMVYSLYRKDMMMNNKSEELIPNIIAMKINYAKEIGSALSFLPASNINNWVGIKAVEIHLLLESEENVLDKPEDYYFYGRLHRATDNHLYREWISVIALRERS